MLADVLEIGYAINSSQADSGAKRVIGNLKNIATEAGKSQKATDRLRDELDRFSKMPKKATFFEGWDLQLGRVLGVTKSLYFQMAALIGLGGAAGLFGAFIRQGVQFNAQIQTSKLGIASLIASLGELRNSAGVKLTGFDALRASIPLAEEQVKKLRIAGLETSATTREMVSAFQTSIGPGLAAGLKLDDVRTLVVDITQAASALGVPLNELAQETRAILSGDIDMNARVAKALGLTNEMVKNWKQQNKLAEELNKRLAVFRASGAEIAKTFAGVTSNFQEALEVLGGRRL